MVEGQGRGRGRKGRKDKGGADQRLKSSMLLVRFTRACGEPFLGPCGFINENLGDA